MSEFNSRQIANTAWAFAKFGQLDEELFAMFARAASLFIERFSPEDLLKFLGACEEAGTKDAS